MSDQLDLNFDAPEPEPKPRPSLLNPAEARRVTEDAIIGAEHLTDDYRKIEMLQAIRRVAEKYFYFTCDQVWDELGEVGDGYDNGSGLGPVMRTAAKSGLMVNTHTTRPSQRPAAHKKPQRLWKSLIYREQAA